VLQQRFETEMRMHRMLYWVRLSRSRPCWG